jgi:hypothetical protein
MSHPNDVNSVTGESYGLIIDIILAYLDEEP